MDLARQVLDTVPARDQLLLRHKALLGARHSQHVECFQRGFAPPVSFMPQAMQVRASPVLRYRGLAQGRIIKGEYIKSLGVHSGCCQHLYRFCVLPADVHLQQNSPHAHLGAHRGGAPPDATREQTGHRGASYQGYGRHLQEEREDFSPGMVHVQRSERILKGGVTNTEHPSFLDVETPPPKAWP